MISPDDCCRHTHAQVISTAEILKQDVKPISLEKQEMCPPGDFFSGRSFFMEEQAGMLLMSFGVSGVVGLCVVRSRKIGSPAAHADQGGADGVAGFKIFREDHIRL